MLTLRGLSPLARGNRHSLGSHDGAEGPIPARAGQPRHLSIGLMGWRAYPRSRGATSCAWILPASSYGLSPLARGNRVTHHHHHSGVGPIPARAGQPGFPDAMNKALGAYPRSRGATAVAASNASCALGLSPLARGNQARPQDVNPWQGPIPARAGQPALNSVRPSSTRAYPRSRGATLPGAGKYISHQGLSPLARGNRHHHEREFRRQGPIPARAGQPRPG